MSVWATGAPTGDGSANDPYRIATLADLQWLQVHVNDVTEDGGFGENYRQTSDIDLSIVADWTPIGESSASGFRGSYDGQGYTISALKVTVKDKKKTGLFSINRGTIKNLGVTGVTITGGTTDDEGVGALTGVNKGSIARCYSTGTIVTFAKASGGLIGQQTIYDNTSTPSTTDCYSRVSVTTPGTADSNYFGGLIGEIASGQVNTSYATGTVDTNAPNSNNLKFSGGISGEIKANANVSDVFSTSVVDDNYSRYYHSGIAGQVGGSLTYAQTTSANAVKNTLTGGITSNLLTSVALSNFKTESYYTGTVASPSVTWSSPTVWNFSTVWTISPSVNDGFPTLRPQRVPADEIVETTTTAAATTVATTTTEATTTATPTTSATEMVMYITTSTTEETTPNSTTQAATTTVVTTTESTVEAAESTVETAYHPLITRSGEDPINQTENEIISASSIPKTGESSTHSLAAYLICAAILVGAYGILQSRRGA